jgi:signal transduction histidine kinase
VDLTTGAVTGAATVLPPRRRPATRTWFGAALVAMALVLVVSALVGGRALNDAVQASNRLSRQILPAAVAAARLNAALLDQETGLRGFVLGRQEEFLRPYDEGLAAERTAAARVRDLLRDDPRRGGPVPNATLLAALALVERRAAGWRADYAEPLIRETRATGATEAADPATLERAKTAFDGVRAALAAQERGLEEARNQASADLAKARGGRDVVFVVLLGAFVLLTIVIAVLLRYAVLRPLARLGASARRVASGEFGHAIEAGGPGDLVQLAADVESMRERISHELTVIREAQTRLETQAAALEEQAVTLRRSNHELEQFAYVASHDLQEPLRKVTAFCQLLEQRYADRLDDRAREYIGFAVNGAKRMQTLISELLTYSRVGRRGEPSRRIDLNRTVDRAREELSARAGEVPVTVERPELPEVEGDPEALSLLWSNLLDNAVKYRRPGQGAMVRIGVRRSGEFWEFSVADTGIGIDAKYAEKIFVIFQRLHARDAYEGTGIGLALCKKIVEYHGGEIALDTAYGDGTRIVFTLPCAPAPAPPATPTETPAETPAGTAPATATGAAPATATGTAPSG